MALSDYALNIENNIYRAASVLVRKSHRENFTFSIVGVNISTDTLSVSGDKRFNLRVGETYDVQNSTGNDGTITVNTVVYDAANDETDVTVDEDITDTTVDGEIALSSTDTDYINIGQVKDAEVSWSVNATDADTAGRQVETSLDMEVTVMMQQTSNTELAELDNLTNTLMDVLFTSRPQSGDVTESQVDGGTFLADDYVLVREALINTEGSLSFSNMESTITLMVPFRILRSDLSDLPVDSESISE